MAKPTTSKMFTLPTRRNLGTQRGKASDIGRAAAAHRTVAFRPQPLPSQVNARGRSAGPSGSTRGAGPSGGHVGGHGNGNNGQGNGNG